MSEIISAVNAPSCPDCGRKFQGSWPNANYCRSAFLLPYISENPGLSTWELSQQTGMPYSDVGRALQKAREWNALMWDEEPRENGEGVRYRYRVVPGYESISGLRCPSRRTVAWAK